MSPFYVPLAAALLGLRVQCRNPPVAAGEFKVTRSRLGSSSLVCQKYSTAVVSGRDSLHASSYRGLNNYTCYSLSFRIFTSILPPNTHSDYSVRPLQYLCMPEKWSVL